MDIRINLDLLHTKKTPNKKKKMVAITLDEHLLIRYRELTGEAGDMKFSAYVNEVLRHSLIYLEQRKYFPNRKK